MNIEEKPMVKSKSSTRIDLAGGTLDLWPLSTLVNEASTINCSIDCFTSVEFEKGEKLEVFVKSPDFEEQFHFKSIEEFLSASSAKLSLLQEAFSILENKKIGLGKWALTSESPAGSGLGGSSSLLISILKVMCELTKSNCCDAELIETAKNIESRVLNSPAGIQDYFSPVKQGLNCISFKESGFVREEMVEALSFIGPCLTIVDSKIKHHSGMNNWEILKKFINGDQNVKKALLEISQTSQKLKVALVRKDFELVADCFKDELEARKKVSNSYINDELKVFLDKIAEIDQVAAYKVCGAGGGGCVLVLHKPDEKSQVLESLRVREVSVLPFSLIGS